MTKSLIKIFHPFSKFILKINVGHHLRSIRDVGVAKEFINLLVVWVLRTKPVRVFLHEGVPQPVADQTIAHLRRVESVNGLNKFLNLAAPGHPGIEDLANGDVMVLNVEVLEGRAILFDDLRVNIVQGEHTLVRGLAQCGVRSHPAAAGRSLQAIHVVVEGGVSCAQGVHHIVHVLVKHSAVNQAPGHHVGALGQNGVQVAPLFEHILLENLRFRHVLGASVAVAHVVSDHFVDDDHGVVVGLVSPQAREGALHCVCGAGAVDAQVLVVSPVAAVAVDQAGFTDCGRGRARSS